jgi:hypothetical protein
LAKPSWMDRVRDAVTQGFRPVWTTVMQPRFAMSFGMAFFSITMLLSIAGFHVADLRNMDLSAKGITRAYYSTETRIVRYYENIRLVYEIETRVRELRRTDTQQNGPEQTAPQNNQPNGNEQKEQEHRNQNYNREMGQPTLAASPTPRNQVMDEVNQQARLKRSKG